MRRFSMWLLVLASLSACGQPVFVPESGPNAPGFRFPGPPPRPPEVEVVDGPVELRLEAGGAIDSVEPRDGSVDITGWAPLAPKAPRGTLRIVVAEEEDVVVRSVTTLRRPDVVEATSSRANTWAGFTVTVEGAITARTPICVVAESPVGTYRLGGSDERLCPG